MGACTGMEEEPEEATRARAVGMTLADNMSPTSEELDELARREAMAPMKINCQSQTDQGEVIMLFSLCVFDSSLYASCSDDYLLTITGRDHGAWLGANQRFDQT